MEAREFFSLDPQQQSDRLNQFAAALKAVQPTRATNPIREAYIPVMADLLAAKQRGLSYRELVELAAVHGLPRISISTLEGYLRRYQRDQAARAADREINQVNGKVRVNCVPSLARG